MITGAITLRTLTLKSKLNFGKYGNLCIKEIINLGHKPYLRWIYYNMHGITFVDEILKEIYIFDERMIKKPGINSELGIKLDADIFNSFKGKHFDDGKYCGFRSHGGKIKKAKLINFNIADRIKFSKSSLQRINQGH